jgi:GABA permease
MTDQGSAFTRIESTRGPMSPEPSSRASRVLVVANTWCQIDGVCAEVRRLLNGALDADVLVIAPALASRTHRWTSDLDGDFEVANDRLKTILARLRRHGVCARGHVADADPILAFQDALAEFIPDAVMLVSEDAKHQSRQEREIFSRMMQLFPVASHIAVAHDLAL